MEASEEKREQYRETIKDIPAESFVYIDESGINMSICKDRRRGKKSENYLAKRAVNIMRERTL